MASKLAAVSNFIASPLRLTIKSLLACPLDSSVQAAGWIRTVRKQKRHWFAEVCDGSTGSTLQAVIPADLTRDLGQLTTGASVELDGRLVKSSGTEQAVELMTERLRLIGSCPGDTYPIQKKDHSAEFLRSNLHFRLRTSHAAYLARLKSSMSYSLMERLREDDFVQMFPPIITEHDCEGGGDAFRVEAPRANFFSKPAYLTVSTQLHLEIAAASLPRVYAFCPIFRAENHHTTRHLAEFWMLECEVAFVDRLDNLLTLVESLLKDAVHRAISAVAGHAEPPRLLEAPFERITYTEAINVLQRQNVSFQFPVVWGAALQTEHERFLAEHVFGGPVFVTDYPAALKPFYMKANPDGRTVACFDLLVPQVGEIVGGSLREDDCALLQAAMTERLGYTDGVDNPLQWYLDLRRYGGVPHGGFGLGFDRMLQHITGTANIRDLVMIPRHAGTIKF